MEVSEYAYLQGWLTGAITGAIKKIDDGIPQLVGFDDMRRNLQRAIDEVERVEKEGIHEVSNGESDISSKTE